MQHLRRAEGREADQKLKEQLRDEEKPTGARGHGNRQETSLKRRNRGAWVA